MAHTPTRRSRILPLEIPLPSKPRDYRPGDGPALAPIRLCLEDDTGAFIVDKRVLPGKPVNGELKLELYYVVGWPDLPAARVAILATKILDYVSPRTLEDWEYKCSLENDKEREKEQEKAAQKRKEAERSAPVTGTSTPGSGTAGHKKRGRPSKAEVLARHIAQQASFGDDELANVPLPPASTNGPSLSTPQKSRVRAVTDAEDIEETDTNDAISKQLQGGSESESESEGESAGGSRVGKDWGQPDKPGEKEKPNTSTMFTSLDSFLPTHSSRGYAEFLIPNPPSPTQQDPTQLIPSIPISFLRPNSINNQLSRRKTQLTTPIPVPPCPRQTGKKTFVPLGKPITPIPVPSLPLLTAKLLGQAHAVSVTPIPAPQYPVPKPKPPKLPHGAKVTPIPAPAYPKQSSQVFHGITQTPIPPPLYPPTMRESSINSEPKKPHKTTCTPIPPPPPPPDPSKKPHKITYTPIPPPPQFSCSGVMGSHKLAGFTPAGYSPKNQATRAEVEVERNDGRHTPSKNATPVAKTSGSRKRKQPQPKKKEVWEVNRLEGDKIIEVNGELVRHFKVRWVGKWPPGQNPTWEPEEYISEDLVRKYLKNKALKMAQSDSSPKRVEKLTSISKRKYSSVAEAFEGDDDDLPMPSSSLAGNAQDDEDDDDDEHFQVTEQTRQNTPFQKPHIDPALVAELAASFV
ncbi:hypothetical protein F4859DRAFT_486477 [Xylaria cf. heliscus]|nr:hypothetical protein F4859DRAFT_486477 [Xylaria cf. heliscus]